MLKQFKQYQIDMAQMQPPSGGCVLKPTGDRYTLREPPAAFGRLCVETRHRHNRHTSDFQPPSGGCVLKQNHLNNAVYVKASRLRAAVC